MRPEEEPMKMEDEHLEETTVAPQLPSTNDKKKFDTRALRRIIRSQTEGKGKIEDVFQAIDIE